MKTLNKVLTIICLLAFTAGLKAQAFMSVAELAGKLNDKNYVVVDARSKVDYGKVHIRNAVNLDVNELSTKTPVEGMMKSHVEIAKILGSKGISNSKTVVAYCNKGNSAGRLYLILKSMGFHDVYLLDGSIDAWKAARKPITRNPSMTKKATFSPGPDAGLILSMADVKKAISDKTAVLVDVRTPDYFHGTHEKSKGHIPGAISLDSEILKDEKGILLPAEKLGKLITSKGISKDREIILYCQSGTRAGFVYSVLTGELGYSKVKVYDGSYNEWSSIASNNIAK